MANDQRNQGNRDQNQDQNRGNRDQSQSTSGQRGQQGQQGQQGQNQGQQGQRQGGTQTDMGRGSGMGSENKDQQRGGNR